MNRRGFISLLAGAAGATLVPWRGNVDPVIVLPPRSKRWTWPGGHYWDEDLNCTFSNQLSPAASLTQESLEEMLARIKQYTHNVYIVPDRLIIPAENVPYWERYKSRLL